MLEDVGRCWKIGLKPGKINSLTRGSSTNESQVTSPSLIFHLANFANVSNYRNGTVLLERTLPCQMWLQMAVHLALVWASSGWFSTSCGRAQHQNSQNPQCSGQIEKYVFLTDWHGQIQLCGHSIQQSNINASFSWKLTTHLRFCCTICSVPWVVYPGWDAGLVHSVPLPPAAASHTYIHTQSGSIMHIYI